MQQPKVSKGLATWAGIAAAVGQYVLAIATFMETFDQVDPLAGVVPLVTATAALWKVIEGRMAQAQSQAIAEVVGKRSSWGAEGPEIAVPAELEEGCSNTFTQSPGAYDA